MLGSIGIKDGIVLYYVVYNNVLGCLAISGVIGCGQPTCWLIGIEPNLIVYEFVVHVHQHGSLVCSIPQAIKKFEVLFSLISSIYHPQKDNS
jgi:hypothetical protein